MGPTTNPTKGPTTSYPTLSPSFNPTPNPSKNPTLSPTPSPSKFSSNIPSKLPTSGPSAQPTDALSEAVIDATLQYTTSAPSKIGLNQNSFPDAMIISISIIFILCIAVLIGTFIYLNKRNKKMITKQINANMVNQEDDMITVPQNNIQREYAPNDEDMYNDVDEDMYIALKQSSAGNVDEQNEPKEVIEGDTNTKGQNITTQTRDTDIGNV